MAVSSDGYVHANVGTTKVGIQGIDSTVDFTGVEVTETGISIARKFGDLSAGITPKVQSITSYDASALLSNNNDLGDILDTATSNGKDHGTTSNLDVGLVYKMTENWKIGAVMRNALSEDYTTSLSKKVTLEPQTRAGIAYTGDTITFVIDYDLAKNDPIVTRGEETQFLNAGVELDLADFFQLRGGYSSNTANSAADPTYSVGFGFNILAVQLDIAAVGNDNSASGYVQLGVRW